MTSGGPSVLYTPGMFIPVSIDNRIHNVAGATFFYVDLYPGENKISATNLSDMKGLKRTFHLGENIVDFELAKQDIKFIKIEIEGINAKLGIRSSTFHPVLIDSKENAEKEISTLKYYKTHETNIKVGGTYY